MGDRFGTNSAIYDLSRLMTFAVGIPAENVLNAPIILDNPSITSGIALFSHTAQPFSVAVAAASELTLVDLDFANTAGAGTQFYGLKIQTDADTVDTAAGMAIFNIGRADAIYIDVAGKTGNPAGNAPTGIGIDINKEIAGANENASANSSQQGIQIWDHSVTDQGVGGPRCLFLNKYREMNTDHFLATFKANRNALQFVMEAADGTWDGTQPLVRVDDADSGVTWWQIRQSGEQIFNRDGIGIQWVTPGPKSAYILASTNDLKLKSGGDAIRFVNEADTQTIVLMNDDLTVDIPNAETRFQAIKIIDDRIENYATNALAAVSVNYNGYAGGTTQFRDFKIFDGKQNVVAIFTGTNKNFLFSTSTDKAVGTPHIFLNNDCSLFQTGSAGAQVLTLAENAWFDGANLKRFTAKNTASIITLGTDMLSVSFQTDAGNTVDSTITAAKYYEFGKTTLSFLGAAGQTKQTVSGYSGGNPALVSLLTGLSNYGLITDSSTAGRPHGSCYGNDIAWTQASAAQNTWYIISDSDMSDGHAGLTAVTHDGSGKLTVSVAGDYDVEVVCSVECSGLNKHIQLAAVLSGTPVDATPHYEVSTPNAQLIIVAIAQVAMAANDYIEAAIRTTDTGTPDLSVDHLAIKLTMIE